MTILDPEILTLASIVLFLTGVMWFTPLRHAVFVGPTVARDAPRRKSKMLSSMANKTAGPVRLAGAPVGAAAPVLAVCVADQAARIVHQCADTPHMIRLANIVSVSIGKAENAKRLHLAANEQVDSADYALQNLLVELAAVMKIVAPARSTRRFCKA